MQSENMQSENVNSEEGYDSGIYWKTFNEYYKKFVDQIKTEGAYILCSHYTLSDSHFELQCGMSFIRSLEPAVRLVNLQDKKSISFSQFEWNELISELSHLMSHYFKKNEQDDRGEIAINSDEGIKIIKLKFMDVKVLKLSSDNEVVFYLKESVVNRILKLNETLITSKILLLNNFDFPEFYGSFIAMLKALSCQLAERVEKPIILDALCNTLEGSLESYCIKECVEYYNDEILKNVL